MKTAEEINPCPFCNSEAKIIDLGNNRFHIRCTECPCTYGERWDAEESEEYLIKGWNASQRDELIKAQKELIKHLDMFGPMGSEKIEGMEYEETELDKHEAKLRQKIEQLTNK